MKKLFFFIMIAVLFSCKSTEKQHASEQSANVSTAKYSGMVSHKFKNEGCKTVIIVENMKDAKDLILIPLKGFEDKFDKDKLKIRFDYLPLRVKNPEGCNAGMPAAISNISIE